MSTTFRVIGLGGVGGIAVRYLALFLASRNAPARLVLVDGDEFEEANAARMAFARCGNKAAVLRDELAPLLGDSRVMLEALESYVTPENVPELVREGDVVLLAVDNHATRKLVSEHCAQLGDVCLISGGNDGVGRDSSGSEKRGTYGNVQVYVRRDGADASPSLTAHHPEIAAPQDALPSDVSCGELVASVPQILFTNLTTATCMLNTLWLWLASDLGYSELHFDVREGLMRPSPLPGPRS